MAQLTLTGDEAFAYGALVSGVKLVTSYPGSPSSGTLQSLVALTDEKEVHIEWSSNEKVAAEMGIGASLAGGRALVCTKSVGMNVMLDPLMALNLTGVHAGLVILLGDDPGAYGSQNEQDTRLLAPLLEMPMLEPATPAEAYAMTIEAFEVSERLRSPVILRETRSFSQSVSQNVEVPDNPPPAPRLEMIREPWRYNPVPRTAIGMHRELHARLARLEEWANASPFDQITGEGVVGVIGCGLAYRKLLDVIGDQAREDLRLLQLSHLFPLARKTVLTFLDGLSDVLVLEENEPFVERQIKAVAHDGGLQARIRGKESGHVPREGELYRWQIERALLDFSPGMTIGKHFGEAAEQAEKPVRVQHCRGCRFGDVLDSLQRAADALGQRPLLVGDPGCLVTVGERLDAKYAMGSAVGVADGMRKVGTDERAVALFGDSSFFHLTLPAIVNAVQHQSDVVMVVLDNGSTVTSGFQPHAGSGRDARGHVVSRLHMDDIARACGVEWIRKFGPDDPPERREELFREALAQTGLALVIVHAPCEQVS
jgi:indolepyruvate ferredoxin oxidoreductase alpha subunit